MAILCEQDLLERELIYATVGRAVPRIWGAVASQGILKPEEREAYPEVAGLAKTIRDIRDRSMAARRSLSAENADLDLPASSGNGLKTARPSRSTATQPDPKLKDGVVDGVVGLVRLAPRPGGELMLQIGSPRSVQKGAPTSQPSPQDKKTATLRDAKALAHKKGLFDVTGINSHLAFDQTDLQYWTEQPTRIGDLRLHFQAVGLLLEAAQRQNIRIDSKAELYRLAGPVFGQLYWGWQVNLGAKLPPIPSADKLVDCIELVASKRRRILQRVDVLPDKIPAFTLPYQDRDALTKKETEDLARMLGLFTRWGVNPRLQCKQGDISYWYQRQLAPSELYLQLLARAAILYAAEFQNVKIDPDGKFPQGVVSFWADDVVIPTLRESPRRRRGEPAPSTPRASEPKASEATSPSGP